MSLSNHYDWIVLGDHPGALLSANLAAKLGLSVLVLNRSDAQKVHFSKRGQCLDLEPNFVTGMGVKGLFQESLRRVSAVPSETEMTETGVLAQVLTPEARLAISDSAEDTLFEVARELRQGSVERELLEQAIQCSDEVLEYWRDFPSRLSIHPGVRKRPKEALTNWDDLLKKLQSRKGTVAGSELLSGLVYALTGQISDDWSSSQWKHALAIGGSGASFRGGMSAFRRLLIRSAKKLGANVMDDVECRRIFVEENRFAGIQVSVSAKMVTGTGCVLGSGIQEVADRFSYTGAKWLEKSPRTPNPSGWRFTVALTVREEALVPGLHSRTIWKEANAPVLEIETADPSGYGSKEPDHKLVFLRTVLPFTQESLGLAYQKMIAARMLRTATQILPFLEYHVLKVYPDFRSMRSSTGDDVDEFSGLYGFSSLEKIPSNLRVYDSSAESATTGVDGMFICAGESFPKLGSLGPTIAALEATAWIAHRSGLPGPFI